MAARLSLSGTDLLGQAESLLIGMFNIMHPPARHQRALRPSVLAAATIAYACPFFDFSITSWSPTNVNHIL